MPKSFATSWLLKGSLVGLGLIAASYDSYAGAVLAHYEEPAYETVSKDGGIEMRAYRPRIVAEVELAGERGECLEQGFRILAGYIFGKNKPALVTREPVGEKISMTAPVASEPAGESRYLVRFFMPSRYDLQNLPVPEDSRVKLRALPSQVFAVRRFSGRWTKKNFVEQRRALLDGLARMQLEAVGPVIDAYYNPPFTLPFMRRNEVMVPVSEDAVRRRI
ncbi:MAG: heme-binding protein [Cyanobacteria bacterium HKST-UBA02]|nr:heme-binding protein [Cyanobacteria bacterium HKST-UBA02]